MTLQKERQECFIIGKCICNNPNMITPCGTLEVSYCKTCGCEPEVHLQ